MGKNIVREALNILHNRRSDEMTAEEIHLVDTVLAFTANELPKVFPEFEGMKLSRILQVTQNIGASHKRGVTQIVERAKKVEKPSNQERAKTKE